MRRRPPRSTRTDTRFPYTTLFRSYTIGLDGVATPAPALVKHAPLGDWVGGDRIGSTEQLEQPGGKQHAQRVAGGAVNDTSHFAISQTGTPRSEAGCRRRC